MTSPTLTFGRHRGQTVDQVPADYARWLSDVEKHRKPGQPYNPLPADIVEAAKARVLVLDEDAAREKFARMVLGGHPTGFDHPIFIIECDGDCHSKSGAYAIDNRWFESLEATLDYLASEFPVESVDGDPPSRSTPDPEDDRIIVWKVATIDGESYRRPVWGFFGWHFISSGEDYACGQGVLPGDDGSLYALAMRDY